MLRLMYITNDPVVAKIAADAGVGRIFIDMEVLGKAERQGGMDTVQSHHVPEDIARVRAAIGRSAEIMARVNPLNPNSQTEIDASIANGADVKSVQGLLGHASAKTTLDIYAGNDDEAMRKAAESVAAAMREMPDGAKTFGAAASA